MKALFRSLTSLRARLAVFCAALVLLFAVAAQAATLTVTNANDTGPGSLRAQIAAAASGDTIVFDPLFFNVTRTITIGAASTPLLIQGKNLTIIGPGSGLLTINGNNVSRGLESWNIGDALNAFDVVISGMKFTACNGASARFVGEGGAIENENRMVLTDIVFVSNTTTNGGTCVDTYGANLTCRNCVFDSNTISGFGLGAGLLLADDATTSPVYVIDQCTFTNNSAAYGPCIYIVTTSSATTQKLTLTCTNTTFSGNTCTSAVGSVLFTTGGKNVSQNLTFRNWACPGLVDTRGGGVWCLV